MGSMNRRNFLTALGAGVTITGMSGSKMFVESAYAAPIAGPKLVNLFLNGGCDMFLLAQPTGISPVMDQLRLNRPTLGVPLMSNENPPREFQRLPLNLQRYTLHDRMPEFQQLFNRSISQCAIVLKAGIPRNATGSHEEAQKDHQTGVDDGNALDNTGWIQKVAQGSGFGDIFNVLDITGGGIATGATVQGATYRPLAVSRLADYGFDGNLGQGGGGENGFRLNTALSMIAGAPATGNAATIQSNWQQISASVSAVQTAFNAEIGALTGGSAFPNTGIGQQMRDIFIGFRGLPTRMAYCETGGYDVHENSDPQGQSPNMRMNMSARLLELNAAVAAFRFNCERVNIWRDMTIVINSEFGRTNRQNSTFGLDHANASLAIVVGGRVRGGVYGSDFTVDELRLGSNSVPALVKIRDVYCDAIQSIGLNPANVFPGFQRTPVGFSLV